MDPHTSPPHPRRAFSLKKGIWKNRGVGNGNRESCPNEQCPWFLRRIADPSFAMHKRLLLVSRRHLPRRVRVWMQCASESSRQVRSQTVQACMRRRVVLGMKIEKEK